MTILQRSGFETSGCKWQIEDFWAYFILKKYLVVFFFSFPVGLSTKGKENYYGKHHPKI